MKVVYMLLLAMALSTFAAISQAGEDDNVGTYTCKGIPPMGCVIGGGYSASP